MAKGKIRFGRKPKSTHVVDTEDVELEFDKPEEVDEAEETEEIDRTQDIEVYEETAEPEVEIPIQGEVELPNISGISLDNKSKLTTTLPKLIDSNETETDLILDEEIVSLVSDLKVEENNNKRSKPTKNKKSSRFDYKLLDALFFKLLKRDSGIDYTKIYSLESGGCLEKVLWPNLDLESVTEPHLLLIVFVVNFKLEDSKLSSPWSLFLEDSKKFQKLFHRIMKLTLNLEVKALRKLEPFVKVQVQTELLKFFIFCFQSLENDLVRERALKLVSISIWKHLASESKRTFLTDKVKQLGKLWRSYEKRYKGGDKDAQILMDKEASFLPDLIQIFFTQLKNIPEPSEDLEKRDNDISNSTEEALAIFGERVLELLIDLQSQLPTRRFVNTLLDDHHFLIRCQRLPLFKFREDLNSRFNELLDQLQFYCSFQIDDFTGQPLSDDEVTDRLYTSISNLQALVHLEFNEELKELAISNIKPLTTRSGLLHHLSLLDHSTLIKLCERLLIRTTDMEDPEVYYDADVLLEILCSKFEHHQSQVDAINSQPLYPDQDQLFNEDVISSQLFNNSYPLPIPKLNLQFLTLHDYLLRNFRLFQLEAYYEIRQDIEDAVRRLAPQLVTTDDSTVFSGWARMAAPLSQLIITEVRKPKLGEEIPSKVIAELQLDLERYSDGIKSDWQNLKKHDVLLLLSIQAHRNSNRPYVPGTSFNEHFGLKAVRGCTVIDVLDDNGKPIDEVGKPKVTNRGERMQANKRELRVALDPNQFQTDIRSSGRNREDIYENFNVVIRRKPNENNFKAVLSTIRDLMQGDLALPEWLVEVLLGYGNPNGGHYSQLNLPERIRLHDTFLDLNHLKAAFPNTEIQIDNNSDLVNVQPPFALITQEFEVDNKRGDGAVQVGPARLTQQKQLAFESYQTPCMGPYPSDLPHRNAIPFTQQQVEAIFSGSNPGLTLIVGPPGTGKTDVAVQIVSNLYHSYPHQKILLITHSNQALNQLFEKIINLDVDPRHLLRLGHGQEELDAEQSFSKLGRVQSFLEQRLDLLYQAARLATSLELPDTHANTCESALQFFNQHILPKWQQYLKDLDVEVSLEPQQISNKDVQLIRDTFPFTHFFADAPQPLFDETDCSLALEAAKSCFRHITKLFERINSIRPFELLRTSKDRADYLLVKEARVVAMTSTHAALKRNQLTELGFGYDSVVVEEAGQILEVETFIPLTLQKSDPAAEPRLQRVVLIGDHQQLPPIVKHQAFQKYGNLQQSMFARLLRLDVPAVHLDYQGRARSQLVDLFRFRYTDLKDLPNVSQNSFSFDNPGFKYNYQFIDCFNEGRGESAPVPYFYQNLTEAEFAVALYMYMRLLGYPASKITLLTTYNGQVALINDILQVRCADNPHLGLPSAVSTVDKYQGQQNDYVILSLVRTKSVGHLRDLRRLTVALSRARLGLYVLGSYSLFKSCTELEPVLRQFPDGQHNLQLVDDEFYPPTRPFGTQVEGRNISGLKELGTIVYNKLEQLNKLIEEAQLNMEDEDHKSESESIEPN